MSFGDKYLVPLGGLMMLALLSLISYLGVQKGIENSNRSGVILGTAGLVLAGVVAGGGVSALIARSTEARPVYTDAFWEQVGQVCAGSGIPTAAAYTGTPGLHPLLYVDPRYEPSNQARIPPAWMPATPQQLELVLCLGPDEFEVRRDRILPVCRLGWHHPLPAYPLADAAQRSDRRGDRQPPVHGRTARLMPLLQIHHRLGRISRQHPRRGERECAELAKPVYHPESARRGLKSSFPTRNTPHCAAA